MGVSLSSTINPYRPPASPGQVPRQKPWLSFWSWQVLIGFAFLFIWFFVGFAISIGGSQIEVAIDALGFVIGIAYVCSALAGAIASLSGRQGGVK
jgi:hypothetical protein